MFRKRLVVIIWFLAFAVSVFGQFQAGSPWPRLQADNSNSGRSAALGIFDGTARWTTQVLNANFNNGSPVIGADGTIYITSVDGGIFAYSPTGTLLWKALNGKIDGLPAFLNCAPVIGSDGTIYVNGFRTVYALSSGPSGGKILWQIATNDNFTGSPTVGSDGNVYAAGYYGSVFAISPGPSGGKILWQAATGDNFNYTCPAIGSDGTIYVAGINGNVFALSSGNAGGKILWQTSTNDSFNGSPAIGKDGTVYAAGAGGNIFAFKPGPAGGAIQWNTNLRSTGPNAAFYNSPAIGPDGTLYFASFTGGLVCAVSPGPSGGSILWSAIVNDRFLGPPAVDANGTIYGEGRSGTVYAFGSGVAGGSIKWTSTFADDSLIGSPAIGSDGTVYVVSQAGFLRAIGPQLGSITLKSFYISPTEVDGGEETIGTVTLSSAAPAGGCEVAIASNDPSVVVPAIVTVPAGRKSIAFDVFTNPVLASGSVTIIAGSGGIAASATLTVLGDSLSVLSLSPTSLIGGEASTGSVTLLSPAPAGGWVVNLSTQYPEYVTVPKTVTIAAGFRTATFKITTKQPGATIECGIYLTHATGKLGSTLTVYGDSLSSLGFSPTTIGGNGASTGTISLTSAAPPDGWLVKLSNSSPDSVSIPSSVLVPAGSTIATFPITTKQMKTTLVCAFHATDGFTTLNASLTIVGDSLSSLTVSPTTIDGSTTSLGTITLAAEAPQGGWLVKLTDTYPDSVFLPASVLIPQGAKSATFTISANQATLAFECVITATDGDSTKTAGLKVVTDSISGLSLNPTTIGGNGVSTGTVTLSSPAPAGGWLVTLASQDPDVSVPTTVLVPANAKRANFDITATQQAQTITSLISAKDGDSSKSVTLTVVGDSLASLTLNPASVAGGASSTGTITLTAPAPEGGWVVSLFTQFPNNVGVPEFVIVPAGATQATFSIGTRAATAKSTCAITVSDGETSQSATLTITKT